MEIEDDIYYYIGKKLIEKKDPLLGCYIERKVRSFEAAIKSLENSSTKKNKKEEIINQQALKVKQSEKRAQEQGMLGNIKTKILFDFEFFEGWLACFPLKVYLIQKNFRFFRKIL